MMRDEPSGVVRQFLGSSQFERLPLDRIKNRSIFSSCRCCSLALLISVKWRNEGDIQLKNQTVIIANTAKAILNLWEYGWICFQISWAGASWPVICMIVSMKYEGWYDYLWLLGSWGKSMGASCVHVEVPWFLRSCLPFLWLVHSLSATRYACISG